MKAMLAALFLLGAVPGAAGLHAATPGGPPEVSEPPPIEPVAPRWRVVPRPVPGDPAPAVRRRPAGAVQEGPTYFRVTPSAELARAAIAFMHTLPATIPWLSEEDLRDVDVVSGLAPAPDAMPYRVRIRLGGGITIGVLASFHAFPAVGEPRFRFHVDHLAMTRWRGWPRLVDDGLVLPGPSCVLLRTARSEVYLKLLTRVAGVNPDLVTIEFEYRDRELGREGAALHSAITGRIDDLDRLVDVPFIPLRWELIPAPQPALAPGLLMRTPLARGRELAASPVLCEEKPDPDDTWLDWYYLATDTAALAAAGPLAEPQFVLESIIVPYRAEKSPSGH